MPTLIPSWLARAHIPSHAVLCTLAQRFLPFFIFLLPSLRYACIRYAMPYLKDNMLDLDNSVSHAIVHTLPGRVLIHLIIQVLLEAGKHHTARMRTKQAGAQVSGAINTRWCCGRAIEPRWLTQRRCCDHMVGVRLTQLISTH